MPNLDQNEADIEHNIEFRAVVDATSASFTVNQTNPGVGPVTVKITAFTTAFEEGVILSTGSPTIRTSTSLSVSIVDFVVKTGNTQFTPVASIDADGNLIITGLSTGDEVQWTTSGTHNRVLIENISVQDGIGNDNNTFDIGGFSIARAQGDSAPIPNILFDDDGPSIDPTQVATPTLTVDESIFATDASASFAGLFTAGAFGNDGPKDADNNDIADADALSYKLGISAPGAASGLTDTLTNEAVTLSVNAAGTVVTGASATGGTVFTITLNAATGLVTLDQVRAVVHDDPLDPDENTSPAQLSAANLVTLTATIIDGDLDTDTATRDIGDAFKFEDDGPSIDPTQVATPTLTVDETIFATDASASFAGLFTAGAFGNDGPKDADNNDIADADALSYKLGISAPGAASGLTDTLTNEAVTLSVNAAGTVVTGASATGGTVFTITLNAATGLVTLDQVRAVVHDDPLDPDENTSPAQLSAANLVTLTATIIDGDLDTDTATRDIGDAFKFEDDGPSIDPTQVATPTLTVDETIFATDASASFAGLFTAGAFGNDGPKDADNNDIADADALSYKLGISAPGAASGLTDTLTNEAVTLSVNAAGTVVTGASATGGTVFTITLNAATGLVTLDQVRAVVHDDPLDPDENTSPAQLSAANLVTLTATIIDGDLDTDTATRDIGDAFKFEDDGPAVTVNDATGNYVAGAQGTWTDLPGADGFESLGVTFDSYQIDDNGSVPVNAALTQTDDFAFEGSITDDFNGDGTDETVDFTLTFDPGPEYLRPAGHDSARDDREIQHLAGVAATGRPGRSADFVVRRQPGRAATTSCSSASCATAPIEGGNPPPPATNDIEDLVVVGRNRPDGGCRSTRCCRSRA